jgi:enamine deaminase RidA (YjgF/YER057c/UK114 family)
VDERTPEQRLAELGIELPGPTAGAPERLFEPVVRSGSLLFVSGQGPFLPDGGLVTGKVGAELDVEQARDAARLTGIQLLAAIRAETGSLDRVRRIVKLLGMVNVAPGFEATPAVIDGCSQLLLDVFGDAGRHARSAVGLAALPFGMCVEIEAVVEIDAI